VSGVATINGKLNDSLGSLPAFKDFYYLPGRQIAPMAGGWYRKCLGTM